MCDGIMVSGSLMGLALTTGRLLTMGCARFPFRWDQAPRDPKIGYPTKWKTRWIWHFQAQIYEWWEKIIRIIFVRVGGPGQVPKRPFQSQKDLLEQKRSFRIQKQFSINKKGPFQLPNGLFREKEYLEPKDPFEAKKGPFGDIQGPFGAKESPLRVERALLEQERAHLKKTNSLLDPKLVHWRP